MLVDSFGDIGRSGSFYVLPTEEGRQECVPFGKPYLH